MAAPVLASDRLRVVVLPDLGGRVWEVTDQLSGRQLLWHHPRLRPAPVAFGAGYDDNFLGGWDELFPNDVPEELGGEAFPDHGEAWADRWEWEVVPGEAAAIRLTLATRISAVRLVRTLRLAPGSDALEVSVELTNGPAALPMLHKQHLAVALEPGSRIDLPAARVEIGDFGTPRSGSAGDRFAWPGTGGADFSAPAPRGIAELLFADDLASGWCACTGPDGVGIGLCFDRATYPSVWTFASWGGWRGLDVAVLEPCTGVGLSVAEGQADGRHRSLAPGETLRTALSAVVYRGLRRVTGISGHGIDCVVEGEQR
ncbi:MAG: hypothetical protein QM779_00735 [Propionicimonas sp.]|uniref:hypothetical protein n=1 Tax=Propionicimonas sp. TaxID=1955623 RepID=UPI003D0B6301